MILYIYFPYVIIFIITCIYITDLYLYLDYPSTDLSSKVSTMHHCHQLRSPACTDLDSIMNSAGEFD